ncbi:MAG: ATP-binding protein [Flavobacteriaceae bacterium]|jgi:predicted ATPase|nr:ATP-binding protein [Flavobacteriaceae bacterium]HTO35205.1 ATP-binding protein [Flavobacterium sp.]
MKQVIVLTGGPGTGKTTVIELLEQKGFCCYPEISRDIINKAREQGIDQLFLENPILFSEMLLEGRKKQFISASEKSEKLIFLDRGLPDVLAYMHYIGDSYPASFRNICNEHKYSKVFLFPHWEEIYISDNERYENFEQSKLIYKHLKETYLDFGYEIIEMPKDTPENRILFILDEISSN